MSGVTTSKKSLVSGALAALTIAGISFFKDLSTVETAAAETIAITKSDARPAAARAAPAIATHMDASQFNQAFATLGAVSQTKPDNYEDIPTSQTGGYKKIVPDFVSESASYEHLVFHQKSSAEMTKAINDCREEEGSCPPYIRDTVFFIDHLRLIKDKKLRALTLHTAVNLWLEYSTDMVAKNIPASLIETARDGFGRCDEIAKFKTYLAAQVGLSTNYERFALFQDGQPELLPNSKTATNPQGIRLTHVATGILIDGVYRVMNVNMPAPSTKPLTPGQITQMIADTSRMSSYNTTLNISHNDFYWAKNQQLQPFDGFAGSQTYTWGYDIAAEDRFTLLPHQPDAALNAGADVIQLTDADIAGEPAILPILMEALSRHKQIATPSSDSAIKPNKAAIKIEPPSRAARRDGAAGHAWPRPVN